MFAIAASNKLEYPQQQDFGSVEHYPHAISDHIEAVLNLPCMDLNLISSRNFRVCLDTVNGKIHDNSFNSSLGAGGPIMKQLLEKFGCTVIALNYETNGKFSHTPEPIPENLTQLREAVKEHRVRRRHVRTDNVG
jgi:phosphomannomutase